MSKTIKTILDHLIIIQGERDTKILPEKKDLIYDFCSSETDFTSVIAALTTSIFDPSIIFKTTV